MHVDMPLSELKSYLGKSPRPADFEEYWDRALLELDEQTLKYELVPAEFQTSFAECYHLYFTGVGGARVHCKFVKPKNAQPNGPGIILFHGYSVDCGEWMDKVTYAAQGFTVIALDCRGQGGPSEDNLQVKGPTLKGHIIRGIDDPNPDNFYYRNVFIDTVQSVRILMSMNEVDPNRIGVFGMSQGGALATACAALEPRIKEAVCIYPFLSDYKRVWSEMDINNSAYEEIAYYFRAIDPNHEREEHVFNKLGYIDIQNLADRIKANVLWVTGLKDTICPPSTQFAAYNKIQSEKELLLYPEYGHEYLPYLNDKAFQRFLKL
jgi:cephalosporin-C deacetylase